MIWLAFLFTTAVIVVGGTNLSRYGDLIAQRTGMSHTWVGVALLASVTSLPELFTGLGSAAIYQLPDIAVGDVLGSCMFNLLILSLLDALGGREPIWTKVHPGHVLSVGYGVFLITLVALTLAVGAMLPPLGWVGLSTPIIILVYFIGIRSIFRYERTRLAPEIDRVAEHVAPGLQQSGLYLRFGFNAALVIVSATVLPRIGEVLALETGLGQSFVGNTFIALSTSLPEVVTCVAAVRLGAADLAFGNLLGSNIFNIAILAVDDLVYTSGPILQAANPVHLISALAAVLMSAIAITGITHQALARKRVLAWDSWSILGVYAAAMGLLFLGR